MLVLAALLVAVGIALFMVDARRRSGSARVNDDKGAAQTPEKVAAAAAPAAAEAGVPEPPEEPADRPAQVSIDELVGSVENDHDPQPEVDGEGDETEISLDSDSSSASVFTVASAPDGQNGPDEQDESEAPQPPKAPEEPETTADSEVRDASELSDEPGETDETGAPDESAETSAEPIAAFAAPSIESIDEGLFGAADRADSPQDTPDEPADDSTEAPTDPNDRGGMPSEDLYAGLDDVPVTAPAPEATAAPTPERTSAQPEVEATQAAPAKSRFSGFAGRMKPKVGGRRARRAWATALQADFEKSDHELSAELAQAWVRGPKGAAQDVVSNIFIDGRRFLLTDLGESTVLALQTPLASDVVLEFARSAEVDSTDLANVGVEDGFLVNSNQPEVIHRIFDDRAHYVLRMMAAKIERQWTEDGWVVAVLEPDSGPTDWNDALEPLADFADIARRLPPAEAPETDVDMSDWDPSRPSTTPAAAKNVENTSGRRPIIAEKYAQEPERKIGGHLSAVPHRDDRMVFTGAIPIVDEEDPVWRPAPEMPVSEPYDLPSRSVSSRFGDLEFRDLGTAEDNDEHSSLPALGEDPEHIRARRTAGRVVREETGPSGIFSDGSPSDEWAVVHADEVSGDNDRDTN